jgi:hypothetical protein
VASLRFTTLPFAGNSTGAGCMLREVPESSSHLVATSAESATPKRESRPSAKAHDYTMQSDDEVVFVLPNESRIVAGATQSELLESAKMLMACTPNGI